MASMQSELTIADVVPDAPFSERHELVVEQPVDVVWSAARAVTAREIRAFGPLMALRGLPRRLTSRDRPHGTGDRTVLETFTSAGFVLLRCDSEPVDGRAELLIGAVGRFWSVRENSPVELADADAFLAFDDPGFAKAVLRLTATDVGEGRTKVDTETLVDGTDETATRRFRRYWVVIRGPSGLIRRSWLAAIDRRAACGGR